MRGAFAYLVLIIDWVTQLIASIELPQEDYRFEKLDNRQEHSKPSKKLLPSLPDKKDPKQLDPTESNPW